MRLTKQQKIDISKSLSLNITPINKFYKRGKDIFFVFCSLDNSYLCTEISQMDTYEGPLDLEDFYIETINYSFFKTCKEIPENTIAEIKAELL